MRRTFAVSAVALVLAATAAATAFAGGRGPVRTDGRNVSTYWTQVDGPPAANQPFGNVHVGWLDAWEAGTGKADAFVYIDDFSCPKGVHPYDGGHGEEPKGPTCTYVGSREGEAYGMALTMDNKLTTARLRGTITMTQGGVHGEGGTVVGRPAADITWKGTGATWRSTSTYRDQSGASHYSDRYRTLSRNATMSGSIGPMGFAPDLSGGSMSTYRSMYRSR